MKQRTYLLLFAVLMVSAVSSCKKESMSDPNSGGSQNSLGTGKFIVAGKTYSGTCVATSSSAIGSYGVDVVINSNISDVFVISNLSTTSSSSTSFSDGWSQPAGSTFGILSVANELMGTRAGGTVTKTGSRSFTFSCTVYDLLGSGQYTVTGSGNYK